MSGAAPGKPPAASAPPPRDLKAAFFGLPPNGSLLDGIESNGRAANEKGGERLSEAEADAPSAVQAMEARLAMMLDDGDLIFAPHDHSSVIRKRSKMSNEQRQGIQDVVEAQIRMIDAQKQLRPSDYHFVLIDVTEKAPRPRLNP